MQRREIIVFVGGLVIGLLVGMILIGSSDDLRESLFGTAGSKQEKDPAYYLVSLDDAETWLAEVFPNESEKFQSSISVLSRLPAVWKSDEDFAAMQQEFAVILPYTYGALKEERDIANLKTNPDDKLTTCVGMDTDPYEQIVYLYVTVPGDQVDKLTIPKNWEKLKAPKENTILWQLVACYPELKQS